MTMRIGGLGSGFDVAGAVEAIMAAESRRVEMAQERVERYNEKIGAWIEVKQNLSGLTRSADTLRWMDVWRQMSTQTSDPSVVTATATSNAATTDYSIFVSQLAHAHTIAAAAGLTTSGGDPVTSTTKLVEIDGINGDDQFSVGGQTFTIAANDTLAGLRNKINAAAADMPDAERVTASILDNRLVLQRELTGDDTIVIADTTGTPLQALGILDAGGDPANELMAAQNAVFSVNNAVVERSSNIGISDVIEGVTLNLQGAGYSTLSIQRDTEAVKDAIRDFIDAYNTAAETNELHASWDRTDPSRPTSGLLQGDVTMRDMIYKLRSQATQLMNTTHTADNASYEYDGRQGIMNSLQHIGIWTEGEANRLAIVDENRLDAMLEQYPDEVENLFRGIPSESKPGIRDGGVAQTMYRTARSYSSELDGWIDLRIENIDNEILRQNERIDRMITELEMREKMLWRQFGAMDEAIGRMQSGFEYLMGQLN